MLSNKKGLFTSVLQQRNTAFSKAKEIRVIFNTRVLCSNDLILRITVNVSKLSMNMYFCYLLIILCLISQVNPAV